MNTNDVPTDIKRRLHLIDRKINAIGFIVIVLFAITVAREIFQLMEGWGFWPWLAGAAAGAVMGWLIFWMWKEEFAD